MASAAPFVTVAFVVFVFARWYQWFKHNSIKHIRGPAVKSKLIGNTRDLGHQESVGDLDFQWIREYGTTWRLRAPLGAEVLMTADPKAFQHIFHKSGYNYPKSVHTIVDIKLLTGESIISAARGEDHARHRKIMNPAFTASQLRSFLPFFRQSAAKLSQHWKDGPLSGTPDGAVIDVSNWLSRTTLDVIGETAFDYRFGALDNVKSEVSSAYDNLFADSVLDPAMWNTVFRAMWQFLPSAALDLIKYIPTREYFRFRETLKVVNRVAKELIDEKAAVSLSGDKSRKDIMSVLVRANASEDPRFKLSDAEMVAQMSAFILAGHETTANTLAWLLFELAKLPDFQELMRVEIHERRAEVSSRGDVEFTMEDLESMPYLQAAIKEVLRYHPIAFHVFRQSAKDDVIPLSSPILSTTGDKISEIPVAAGQIVIASICGYNRLHSIWGEDADVWNPMRFIDGNINNEVKVGMLGNLMTFAAGVRGCIGWRFSLIEMQAIVVDLLENFRFAIPADKPEIIRAPIFVMSPMVKGRMQEGVQMPLHVTPL